MTTIVALFLIGALLLAIELFVPGMIVGIIGGLALLAGVVTAFNLYGALGGILALLGGGLLVGVTLYLEFVVLPKTRLAKKFSMTANVDGTSQPAVAELAEVIDQSGETITPLAPTGYISLHGRRYEAFSQSGFLAKGVSVRVTGLDNFRLIVTQNKTSS